jgi:predicted transcriptional regulator
MRSEVVIADRRLKSSCKAVLDVVYILGFSSGECFASLDTIAEKCGLSARTVQRCLNRLVETGYLGYRRDPTKRTGRIFTLDWIHDSSKHPQRGTTSTTICRTSEGSATSTTNLRGTHDKLSGQSAFGHDNLSCYLNQVEVEEKERKEKDGGPSHFPSTQPQRTDSPLKANSEPEASASGGVPGKIELTSFGYADIGLGHYTARRRGSEESYRLTQAQLETLKRQCSERGGSARMADEEIDRMLAAIAKEPATEPAPPPKAEPETHELSKYVRGLMKLGLSLEAALADEKRREASLKAIHDPAPEQVPAAKTSDEQRAGQRLNAAGLIVACLGYKKPELSMARAELARDAGLRQFMLDQGGEFAAALERLEQLIHSPTEPEWQASDTEEEPSDEEDIEADPPMVAAAVSPSAPRPDPLLKIILNHVESGCDSTHVTAGAKALCRALDDEKSFKYFCLVLNEVRAGSRPSWHVTDALDEALDSDSDKPGRVFNHRISELRPVGQKRKGRWG